MIVRLSVLLAVFCCFCCLSVVSGNNNIVQTLSDDEADSLPAPPPPQQQQQRPPQHTQQAAAKPTQQQQQQQQQPAATQQQQQQQQRQPQQQQQQQSKGKATVDATALEVQHAFGAGEFEPRGQILYKKASRLTSTWHWTPSDLAQLKEVAQSHGVYRVRVALKNGVFLFGAVRAADILASESEEFVLRLESAGGQPVALNYKVGASVASAKSGVLTSMVSVQAPSEGARPRLDMWEKEVPAAEADQGGGGLLGLLKRYWYVVVPFVIMMMLQSAMAPDEEEGASSSGGGARAAARRARS